MPNKGTIQSDYLMEVMLKLSRARNVSTIIDITRLAGRKLTGADGATFILKDNDKCYYVDEDAIFPLWKGRRFPLEACISGWAMLNKSSTVIKDIFKDSRIPVDAYSPTFVKSLAMVPINVDSPIGAIGNYWAHQHEASDDEVDLLAFLAELTSVALQNVEVLDQLERMGSVFKDPDKVEDQYMSIVSHSFHSTTNGRLAISNEIDRLRELIGQQVYDDKEKHVKKIVYEISLKQLNEMDALLRNFMQTKKI